MAKSSKISVSNTEITIIQQNNEDYISLTDMAGYKDNLEARIVVSNWMSTHFTVDFLAVWEQVNNPNFNRMGFHTVRNGEGRLFLTPKRWVEMTNAIGIFSNIRQGLVQNERLIQLNKVAITQMKSLLESNAMKKLK